MSTEELARLNELSPLLDELYADAGRGGTRGEDSLARYCEFGDLAAIDIFKRIRSDTIFDQRWELSYGHDWIATAGGIIRAVTKAVPTEMATLAFQRLLDEPTDAVRCLEILAWSNVTWAVDLLIGRVLLVDSISSQPAEMLEYVGLTSSPKAAAFLVDQMNLDSLVATASNSLPRVVARCIMRGVEEGGRVPSVLRIETSKVTEWWILEDACKDFLFAGIPVNVEMGDAFSEAEVQTIRERLLQLTSTHW